MKAIDLLKSQHGLVKQLFARIDTANGAEKVSLFEKLAANLVAHDVIEREIFYPACEAAVDDEVILGEAIVEHGVIEFCLLRADMHRRTTDFDSYLTVLKEMVEHHVKEEEDDLFRKVKGALDDERQEALGEQMEHRFDKAMKADVRKALKGAVAKATHATRGRATSVRPASKGAKPAQNATMRARSARPHASR